MPRVDPLFTPGEQMFVSTHYAGEDLELKFREGELWKKVFGPVFIYLNSTHRGGTDPLYLWEDAKSQVPRQFSNQSMLRITQTGPRTRESVHIHLA